MSEKEKDERVSDRVMASTHLRERREVRCALAVPIFVNGVDRLGQVFHERTVTTDVSTWGCGFRISVELKADDIVALQGASAEEGTPRKQSFFQVMRVNKDAECWIVGAWKVDGEKFWDADVEETLKREEKAQESSGDDAFAECGNRMRRDQVR